MTEAGQPSGSFGRAFISREPNTEESSIAMMGGDEQSSGESKKTKIQRVPWMLKRIQTNRISYDPTVVSIGPYHHGKSDLEQLEKLKIPTVHKFFEDKDERELNVLNFKFLVMACNAREFYVEGSTNIFDDQEFMRMMFIDGCFVLHFIYCVVNYQLNNLMIKPHQIGFVRQDLFLLENQLPYVVLETLMFLRFPGAEGDREEMMKNFIKGEVCPLFNGTRLISSEDRANKRVSHDPPLHLLELLRKELLGNCTWDVSNKGIWSSYRSVEELITVGIDFKLSKTDQLCDISYRTKGCGAELSLPAIAIDDSSESKFLNLIAYESCPDSPEDYGVTSYICFMDSLIDNPKDVKELRSKGILLNSLGNDEQVAVLFNRLSDKLLPNPHAYGKVKQQIEEHYKNKGKIWMAEIRNTHFRNPWTILALFGALLLLALTTTQTYFTIFPRE